jgi:hypothetical protein
MIGDLRIEEADECRGPGRIARRSYHPIWVGWAHSRPAGSPRPSGRRSTLVTSLDRSPRGGQTADVPVVRMHDLRHTGVRLLLSLGVPPRVVIEIVGHAALEIAMNMSGTWPWTTSAPQSAHRPAGRRTTTTFVVDYCCPGRAAMTAAGGVSAGHAWSRRRDTDLPLPADPPLLRHTRPPLPISADHSGLRWRPPDARP